VSLHAVDVVKSLLQTQPPGVRMYAGTIDCAKRVVAEHGARALFRGLGPVAVRAFPAHAIGFFVYEWTLRMLPAI
jgi:hypothetical protein